MTQSAANWSQRNSLRIGKKQGILENRARSGIYRPDNQLIFFGLIKKFPSNQNREMDLRNRDLFFAEQGTDIDRGHHHENRKCVPKCSGRQPPTQ